QVGDMNLCASQGRRTDDDGAVLVIALTEATTATAETLAVKLALRAHVVERGCVAKAVLVHSLVHDRDTLGLRERHDERLLPIGHEARMHIGLEGNRAQRTGTPELDALVADAEIPSDTAECVQER